MAQLNVYRQDKNSIWPGVDELQNTWTWIVLGCGVAGVALEQALLTVFDY